MIFGHHHLNVTSLEAHRRFFADTLGGRAIPNGPTSDGIVAFPNALILLRPQVPTGGTKGTTVNHFAFGVPNIRQMVDRVQQAGYPIVTRAEVPASLAVNDGLCYMADQQTDVAFVMAPDDTKVEFIEIKAQLDPIALHHIHFSAPDLHAMKAWYVKAFDAKPGRRGNFEAADMPGVNLTYSPAPAAVVGTRGRALDHIGFEVTGLESFCNRVQDMGITVERQAGQAGQAGQAERERLEGHRETKEQHLIASAFISDPWGTLIELTEGWSRVS
jgi:catechol 2,3-dioxygenase-like lactoylglutathione lyase family enzyme